MTATATAAFCTFALLRGQGTLSEWKSSDGSGMSDICE